MYPEAFLNFTNFRKTDGTSQPAPAYYYVQKAKDAIHISLKVGNTVSVTIIKINEANATGRQTAIIEFNDYLRHIGIN